MKNQFKENLLWRKQQKMQEIYRKELISIRKEDVVDEFREDPTKYTHVVTETHGYLIVPIDDINIDIAMDILDFGYIGDFAIYLEEEEELPKFLKRIKKNTNKK